MDDPERQRIVEFNRLNLLGKAVYLTGAAVRGTARAIDVVLERAADIVVETERAFRQGLDPNVEEAKIIEERENEQNTAASREDTDG